MKLHFQRMHPVENLSSKLTYSVIKETVAETMFKCPECQKEFKDAHRMRSHVAYVHENRKPYECTECQRFMRTKTEIAKHNLRMHEGSDAYTRYNAMPKGAQVEKKFKCPVCSVGFSKVKQMKVHVNRFHPNQAEELLPTLEAQKPIRFVFYSFTTLKLYVFDDFIHF